MRLLSIDNKYLKISTSKKIIEKRSNQRLPFTTYMLAIFIIFTIINNFQFGVGLSGMVIPIGMYMLFLLVEKKTFKFTRSHTLIILFWFSAVLATFLSTIVIPQRDIISFLVFTLFYIFTTAVSYKKFDLKYIIRIYILVSFFSSINIIWNFLNEFAYGWQRYSLYVFGVYRDPNYVSAFVIPAICLVFYELLFNDKMNLNKRVCYYLALVIMTLGILTTGSRGAFSITVLVLLMNLGLYFIKVRSIKMVFGTIAIVVFLTYSWLIFKNFLPEFVAMRLTGLDTYSDDVRLSLWTQAIELFKLYPILGSGMESANIYLAGFGRHNTHNLFLGILIGQGLVGVILLGLIFKRYLLVKRADKPLMIILIISSFAPLFFINGFNTATFWTPLILCEILSNYSRNNPGGIHEIWGFSSSSGHSQQKTVKLLKETDSV